MGDDKEEQSHKKEKEKTRMSQRAKLEKRIRIVNRGKGKIGRKMGGVN